MGGGHVSRPDFGMPQPDPAHPLTEFYCLLQRALDREGVFALPALYAQFRAPARRIYADEAADFLTLSPDEEAEIDACPAALGHRLACDKAGKRWLHHPRAETYLSERVALFQRLYR